MTLYEKLLELGAQYDDGLITLKEFEDFSTKALQVASNEELVACAKAFADAYRRDHPQD